MSWPNEIFDNLANVNFANLHKPQPPQQKYKKRNRQDNPQEGQHKL